MLSTLTCHVRFKLKFIRDQTSIHVWTAWDTVKTLFDLSGIK